MGLADWDRESTVVKEKLAKAYGRSAEGGVAEATEAPQPEVTYKSSGVVLNIGATDKADFQTKLDELSTALSSSKLNNLF